MVWHQEIHPVLHSTRDIGSGKLMAAILENGAVCKLHTLLTMSSRSFVTLTPQWLILDMQTNVIIWLPVPSSFWGLRCSTNLSISSAPSPLLLCLQALQYLSRVPSCPLWQQYLVVSVQWRGPCGYLHPKGSWLLHLCHWFSHMLVPLFRKRQAIPLTQTPVDDSSDSVMSFLILQLWQLAAFTWLFSVLAHSASHIAFLFVCSHFQWWLHHVCTCVVCITSILSRNCALAPASISHNCV